MDRHRGRLAGTQEPLLRSCYLSIFHLGPHPIIAAAFHDGTGEHDSPLEYFRTLVGQRHFHRDGPVSHNIGIKPAGIDVALNAKLIGSHHSGQRIAGLHPFSLVRKYLHHNTLQGRLDLAPLNGVFSGLHLHLLGLCREGCQSAF